MRLPLVAALAVVAVLAGALLLLDGDDGVHTGVLESGPGRADGPGTALPAAVVLPATSEGAIEALAGAGVAPVLAVAAPERATLGPVTTGVVSGRLVDEAGSPVAGAPVHLVLTADAWGQGVLRPRGPEVIDRGHSGADGAFALAARAGARHSLTAGGSQHGRVVVVPVTAGDDLLITLPPGRRVRGTVLDEPGLLPVGGAWVGALGGDDRLLVRADDEGRFELAPVVDGTLAVAAWALGHDVGRADLSVAGADLADVALVLPPGRDVEAVVIDKLTRLPVDGARVRLVVSVDARPAGQPDPLAGRTELHAEEALAGPDGAVVFAGAPSQFFRLEAQAEGYVTAVRTRWEERRLGAAEVVVLDLEPERRLTGIVVDGEDGDPVAGARVTLADENGQLLETLSAADGGFTLVLGDWTGRGPLALEASDDAGRFARLLPKSPTAALELGLMEPLALDVDVQSGGEPVAGAQVVALSPDSPPAFAATDSAGRARLVHRLSGAGATPVSVSARHGSSASVPLEIDLAEGRPTAPLLIDLGAGDMLGGEVQDAYGLPVPGALVVLAHGPFGRTDAAGRFELAAVDPELDPLTLHVSAREHRDAQVSVAAPQQDLLVVLEPLIPWEVVVIDGATGLPMPGVAGRLRMLREDLTWDDADAGLQALSAEEGRYEVDLPGAGRYALRLWAPDRVTQESVAVDFDGLRAPLPLQVVMLRAAVLEVAVLEGSSRPVPGVTVTLFNVPASEADLPEERLREGKLRNRTQRVTGNDGVARFNLGEGGVVRVTLNQQAWAVDAPLRVDAGPPTRATVRLPSGGDLLVTVRDEQQRALGGASVVVTARGKPRPFELRRKLSVPALGDRVLFEALPAASYQVRVELRGFVTEEREIWVGGGSAIADFELRPMPPKLPGNSHGAGGAGAGAPRGG